MSRLEDSWSDVGEQFTRLGVRLKAHFDERGVDEAVDVSGESVEDALQRLGEGIEAAVGAVGDSVTDPEVTNDVRDAAASLFTALGATFAEVGERIAAPHDTSTPDADAVEESAADGTVSAPDGDADDEGD